MLNKTLVFNYENAKDQKEARSHIYKLRQLKSAVEIRRGEAKKDSLEYGRKIDAHANEIKEEIENMISVHMVPILAIEQREKDQETYKNHVLTFLNQSISFDNVDTFSQFVATIDHNRLPESCISSIKTVVTTKEIAIAKVFENRQKHESDMLELDRLRRETAARQAQENEMLRENERIAREHFEQAEAEKRAKEDAERKEAAALLKKQQDEIRAEREKLEREQRERIAQEKKAAEIARDEAARKANLEHRKKINHTVLEEITPYVLDVERASALIKAIVKGSIPNVKIEY
jgi:hypothetical protein